MDIYRGKNGRFIKRRDAFQGPPKPQAIREAEANAAMRYRVEQFQKKMMAHLAISNEFAELVRAR